MAEPLAGIVAIVTQTRALPGCEQQFALWQEEMGRAIAQEPGFIDQKVMPPSPPAQVDWVILQRFESSETAVAWLHSDNRLAMLSRGQSLRAGGDDVHLVSDSSAGVLPSPASAVISTRVKPGHETDYQKWEQRIAAAQSRAPGFQGYRIEPPVPGVQEDWLAIVRFDSEDRLQNWLNSEERKALLKETPSFIETFHARVVRTGFDQWFPEPQGSAAPPAWKQNMIVVLMLYPVVFLFGHLVQAPLLIERAGIPFWLALFIGNVVSVILLNFLVPWTSNRFRWWLQPGANGGLRIAAAGAAIIMGFYAVLLLIFSQI
ncbi:hypothetical protein FHS85_002279 [Rhodoligotrophos appendicifer]|uniref:antibiotic biosynthesis monooxygenase n=1 Tax=Rhodoligotrophos appendicifer TaxID=987056 RepID=UPI001185715A|nr:antibiotic biosynthesis monooxygenase [Rhodoligotrophos appendicifer]